MTMDNEVGNAKKEARVTFKVPLRVVSETGGDSAILARVTTNINLLRRLSRAIALLSLRKL